MNYERVPVDLLELAVVCVVVMAFAMGLLVIADVLGVI